MQVKIAAAQFEIIPFNIESNYKKIAHFSEKASKEKSNFLCLPEECWSGPGYQERVTNEVSDFVKDKVPKLCKKYNLYCIAGTVVETDQDTGKKQNTSYFFDSDGKILGSYSKIHPVPKAEEGIAPGISHKVFDTEFGKVGIQICRDILYPEVTKITADLGAKIIFSPAFWSSFSTEYGSSLDEFHTNDELQMIKALIPARALENEVIFVFTNAAGNYETPERKDTLLGYTQIAEPFVGVLEVFRHNKEQILIKRVDLDIVEKAREEWKIRGH